MNNRMFKHQNQKKEERVMKHLKEIGMVIMLLLFMMPLHANAEGLGNARISLLNGDVQIQSEDSPEWFPAGLNMPLRDGDRIWVPEDARAEIQLAGGTRIRLDELSSLDILNLSTDSSQFSLAEGLAYVNFRPGRNDGLVQIDTPVSSFRTYDGAAFGVDAAGSGDTILSVFQGQVQAETRSGRTRVKEGNSLEIGDDYADLVPLGRETEWERWNLERDRRVEQKRNSSRYLPEELDVYAGDFDDNGKWVDLRGHGQVWIPTVQVSAGWSPYRNGRWSWIGNDYVWVGYEPWGWAPYHYGRWDYDEAVGWFWVPPARGDVYWGPGYVGWVRTADYVAWIPLAPRDTYYGYGNYGRHSVNLTNMDVNAIVMKQKYRNVHVHNAVTTVHHDTFVRGRRVDDFKVRENPFLREKIRVGRPDIKPERESRMAVLRDIPKAKEPPRKIRDIKVKETREARPLVRDKDKSAFSHDKPDRQMKVQTFDKPTERGKDRSEERSKERDRKVRSSEKPQADDKGRDLTPSEKKRSDEKNIPQQERQGTTRKEQGSGTAETPPADSSMQKRKPLQPELQEQKAVQPKQEVRQPERPVKKDSPVPPGLPEQPKVKQKESAPPPDRQMQREERKQKPQDRQPEKQDKPQEKPKEKDKDKDKSKKGRDDKDEQKRSGEGGQQSPVK
jgi:hypothetical protein